MHFYFSFVNTYENLLKKERRKERFDLLEGLFPKPEAIATSPAKSSWSWEPEGRAIGARLPGDKNKQYVLNNGRIVNSKIEIIKQTK